MSGEQRTPEWFAARLGCVTASMADCVLAGKDTAKRQGYLAQLVAERLTGRSPETFLSPAMQWGIDTEPLARAAYQSAHELVDEVGFVRHPQIEWCGASPDGMVGDDGLIEIKCPNSATHVEYLIDQIIPPRYKPQMMLQLACTQRKWCDFVSFDPRLPEDLQLFVLRFVPEPGALAKLENAVREFLADVESTIHTLGAHHASSI